MATRTLSTLASFATDADFRSWGSAVSTALGQVGLVQTSDTGQINWTTVTKPAAINTTGGYEVWRFNDTLQATKPVYMTVWYGVGTNVAYPAMWVQVSPAATNGAGGHTSAYASAQRACATSAANTASTFYNSYISGSTDRIHVMTPYNASASSIFWFVERTKDATGASTGDGILFGTMGGVSLTMNVLYFDRAGGSTTSTWPMLAPSGWLGTPLYGTDAAVGCMMVPIGQWRYGWMVTAASGSVTHLSPTTLTHLGASHTFLPFTNLYQTLLGYGAVSATTDLICIPWE